jgi:CDP-glucose 4,6-dehydratase
VTGYSLAPPTAPSLFELAAVAAPLRDLRGDIRDGAMLSAAIAEAGPSIVFHLAAQSLVRRAHRDPVGTFSTNVIGTVQLLEAVRRTRSIEAAVIVTSDKVYANRNWAWAYRETDRLGGSEPYNASKACCELIVDTWRHSYLDASHGSAVALATARAGNVIGGGDFAEDRLVPDAMRAFGNGQPLIVRSPDSVRPWQHVLDPLVGYCLMAEQLARRCWAGPTLNFGPGTDGNIPVRAVADRLTRLWGDGANWTVDSEQHPYEARLLDVDSSLARTQLGWSPRWWLDQGLAETVRWYRAFSRGENMARFTRDQVEAYLGS